MTTVKETQKTAERAKNPESAFSRLPGEAPASPAVAHPEDTTFTAVVSARIKQDEYQIVCDEAVLPARKAVSLLLDPAAGDLVMCFVHGGKTYVTDILKSGSKAERTVTLPERVTLLAEDELEIVAKSVAVNAVLLETAAASHSVAAKEMRVRAGSLQQQCSTLHDSAGTRIVSGENLKERV